MSHIRRYKGNHTADCNTVMLPINFQIAPGAVWEDFETSGDWTIVNGTIADNTTQYKTGTKSMKLTTDSGLTATMTKTVNWDMSGNWGGLSFWIYLHNTNVLDYGASGSNLFLIQLANNTAVSNTMRYWIYINQLQGADYAGYSTDGWHRIYIPKAYFGVQGTGTFASAVIRLRLTVYSAASTVAEISFDDFEVGETHVPITAMRFDDGSDVHYSVAHNYMKPMNLKGTAYINTGNVGQATYLTYPQIMNMVQAGWVMGNHTRDHTSLGGLSEANQEAAINNGKNDMITAGLGAGANYFAYAGGGTPYDANTLTAVAACGMVIGSYVFAELSTSGGTTGYVTQIIPDLMYGNLWWLRDQGHISTTSLATAQAMLTTAINSGIIFIPLFHRLDGTGQWTAATFKDYCDYVYGKIKAGLLYSVTIDDIYKATLGPVKVAK
jgi:peptidoglycan/xylan/chitin deacetylase (PgdA/CDA1 family)